MASDSFLDDTFSAPSCVDLWPAKLSELVELQWLSESADACVIDERTLTARSVREIAMSILVDAENARDHFAQQEAEQGIPFEYFK